ncbi:hypothetical protein GCM10011360_10640 [Primorskyibacter flagellatus]|uniref:DUF4169 family protein n=1 Tax=Primorskyibacter flagellatus TaxID=1387277 RepID=A0A917A3I0_9RHOB|nr:DUF4169 family protein [Primorskyibacter flagellatus]GGE24007.1 hypothetical protein GCM10011360_10640 [Primorskyibacter flagellatus]
MAEIVNLNRFRKNRARAEKRAEADANAARHGQTKAERQQTEAEKAQAAKRLDGHRLEEPEE